MNKLILKSLRLVNFKGCVDKTFEFEDNGASIYGDNGTGKTTVIDGFSWCLFGKDSAGKAVFQIKPLNEDGSERHNLETMVHCHFLWNGKKLELKRGYKEKYNRIKKSSEFELTGHTSSFFKNDAPMLKKDYNEFISDIIDIEKFKMITNPYYFNSIDWLKRRDVLIEIGGDVDDQGIIIKHDLGDLGELLEDHSLAEISKIILSKKAGVNKELEYIPERIDELNISLNGLPTENIDDLEKESTKLKEYVNNIENGNNIAIFKKQKLELEDNVNEKTRKNKSEKRKKIKSIEEKLNDQTLDINKLKDVVSVGEVGVKNLEKDISDSNSRVIKLREDYVKIKPKIVGKNCTNCLQILPISMVESTQKRINLETANKKEVMQIDGDDLNKVIAALVENKEEAIEKLAEDKDKLEEAKENLAAIKDQIAAIKNAQEEPDADIDELLSQIEAVQIKIDENITDVSAEKDSIKEISNKIARISTKSATDLRIEELVEKQNKLKIQFDGYLKIEFQLDIFNKEKAYLINESVNNKFKYVNFKLFKSLMNENVEPICLTTFKGVPFGEGLNKGAEINSGLDIINTLSEFYDVTMPIFLDNAECVTKLINVESQMIKLFVAKGVTELEVR